MGAIANALQPEMLLIKTASYTDITDFFAMLFNWQQSWGKPYVETSYFGKNSVDRSAGMNLRSIITGGTPSNWLEFQAFIDTAYQTIKPITQMSAAVTAGTLSVTDATAFFNAAGIHQRPTDGGTILAGGRPITTLVDSNGTVVATGLNTDPQWEVAWNTIVVPAVRGVSESDRRKWMLYQPDRGVNNITNLAQKGEPFGFFRQSTVSFDGTS